MQRAQEDTIFHLLSIVPCGSKPRSHTQKKDDVGFSQRKRWAHRPLSWVEDNRGPKEDGQRGKLLNKVVEVEELWLRRWPLPGWWIKRVLLSMLGLRIKSRDKA